MKYHDKVEEIIEIEYGMTISIVSDFHPYDPFRNQSIQRKKFSFIEQIATEMKPLASSMNWR